MFKCEMCDYQSKKKITLMKHVNTKHVKTNTNSEKKKGKVEPKKSENREKEAICENCESCESCDYFNNCERCELCRKVMYAWAAEQCGVEWSG